MRYQGVANRKTMWCNVTLKRVRATIVGVKLKRKVYRRTGTEALCRPYGPQGEQRYSSTLSWPRHQKGVRGQCHAPAALYTRERPGTHCAGGWVGLRAGLDRYGKSRPHRDSIPGPSSPQPVAIPTKLLGPHCCSGKAIILHILSVCLCSLRYPACNALVPYCHLWSVRLYKVFPLYLINGTNLK